MKTTTTTTTSSSSATTTISSLSSSMFQRRRGGGGFGGSTSTTDSSTNTRNNSNNNASKTTTTRIGKRLLPTFFRNNNNNNGGSGTAVRMKIIVVLGILLILLFHILSSKKSDHDNQSMAMIHNIQYPVIGRNGLSPIIFCCCQSIPGTIGNPTGGIIARTFYQQYQKIAVDVRYMELPCFTNTELQLSSSTSKSSSSSTSTTSTTSTTSSSSSSSLLSLELSNKLQDGTSIIWPLEKQFPKTFIDTIFIQRMKEIQQQNGILLADGNCQFPPAEISNIWLEALLTYSYSKIQQQEQEQHEQQQPPYETNRTTTIQKNNNNENNKNEQEEGKGNDDEDDDDDEATVSLLTPTIWNKFKLQDKKQLRQLLVQYGFESYVPKHYPIPNYDTTTTTTTTHNITSTIPFPIVLKREQAEGGVGVYICHSHDDIQKYMKYDTQYETKRHKKARHRSLNRGWILEEFLSGSTQELIIYLRPRPPSTTISSTISTSSQQQPFNNDTVSISSTTTTTTTKRRRDYDTYFWCGSHSNRRWKDDGYFVKGYDNIRGTITTPTNCSEHEKPMLVHIIQTILENENIYGTGCINYKYGTSSTRSSSTSTTQQQQQIPKIHDWNLRTCSTMAYWSNGAVFQHLINQIPRRGGSPQVVVGGDTTSTTTTKNEGWSQQLALF